MTAERWRQIELVYHEAIQREPQGRADYIAEVCHDDEDLRKEVESLLARDPSSSDLVFNRTPYRPSGLPALPISGLAAGVRLGHYEILEPIGAGGMGVVYRARDAKLKRDVALKVLPDYFASDPERMSRFEREAHILASLNHPNIAQIYGIEECAIVMELVNGESPKGPMPFDEAWKLALQIAEALEYAHDKGIVHRDLKPANIRITPEGTVKLLDFGLAKTFPGDASLEVSGKAAEAGVILGTAPYMSPEQAVGKEIDRRTDIWAFGVVLYELLTGRRPFGGEGVAGTLAAVINETPDLTRIPPRVRPLVEHCLQKNPKERLRHIGDLGLLLSDNQPTAPPRPARRILTAGALAVLTILLAAVSFMYFREQAPPQQIARMSVLLPEKSRVLSLAVSPNGREVAMVLMRDGKQRIWVRPLDVSEPTELAGTDNAADPFWSPDSRFIAFFADSKLKKIEHSGGPVQTLCAALGALGGTWNEKGDILIGGLANPQLISSSGGAVRDVPNHPTEIFPVFLPDGRHYLAERGPNLGSPQTGIWLSSIENGEERHILPDLCTVQIVAPPPGSNIGDVLFTRNGTLMALRFDMKRLEASGDPFPIAQGIAEGAVPRSLAAASMQGVLAFVIGQPARRQYIWRDRQGKNIGSAGLAGYVVAISPDGKRLVGDRGQDIWILEFATGLTTRVTVGSRGSNPIWSADGRSVAYGCTGGFCRKTVDGMGTEEFVVRSPGLNIPKSWSPDGRFIIYANVAPGAGADLFAAPVDGSSKPFAVAQTPANEDQGQFSPDGHFVAYTSDESGLSDIYVVPFPPSPGGGRWQVSAGGGVQPRWRRDGKELFYISPDWKMMAVDVATRPGFQSGTPRALFTTDMVDTGIRTGPLSWDVAPGGDRFLIISENSNETSSINVTLNWRAGQRQTQK